MFKTCAKFSFPSLKSNNQYDLYIYKWVNFAPFPIVIMTGERSQKQQLYYVSSAQVWIRWTTLFCQWKIGCSVSTWRNASQAQRLTKSKARIRARSKSQVRRRETSVQKRFLIRRRPKIRATRGSGRELSLSRHLTRWEDYDRKWDEIGGNSR